MVAGTGVRTAGIGGATHVPRPGIRRGTVNHSRDRQSLVVDGAVGRRSPMSRDITNVRSAGFEPATF